MSEAPRQQGNAAPVFFDAELRPHRSLDPRGFVLLMTAVCIVSFTAGMGFFLAGAWPVIGFLGVDVLLIYLAFRINYRSGGIRETLRLTPGGLEVVRQARQGARQSWKFQSAWLQVQAAGGRGKGLRLRSHGKSLVVGSFLTPRECDELARALQQALMECRTAR